MGIVYNQSSVWNTNYHLIFCPKYRNGIFSTNDGRLIIEDLLREVAREKGIEIINLEITPDHVELTVSFKPAYSISTVVKFFKGITARHFLIKYPGKKDKIWDSNYFVSTLGKLDKDVVNEYIKKQWEKAKDKPVV